MSAGSSRTGYYADKGNVLARLFGGDIELTADAVVVNGQPYRVLDDVIVVLPPEHSPGQRAQASEEFAPGVQRTFGDQWQEYSEVTHEHREEFGQYFDVVDLPSLNRAVVADLGCGSGRYAACAAPHCGSLVLVDFSEAIFVARRNLAAHPNAIFVMGDLLDLPFADNAFDFVYTLGVLHHLPVPALDALRRIRPLTPRMLVYLYYALDNRPWYFRGMLAIADALRRSLCGLRSRRGRAASVWLITLGLYWPLSRVGALLAPIGLDRHVPLAEFYRGKSLRRLRQDAHDRFLTPIEQRFSRRQIEQLANDHWDVVVSDHLPYWHFLYSRREMR